jgi:hypothetical protein
MTSLLLPLIPSFTPIISQVFWHSSAHVLGAAIEAMYGAHLTIGPPLQVPSLSRPAPILFFLSYSFSSYPVLCYPVLSCRVVSCRVLFCPILSYPVLSCLYIILYVILQVPILTIRYPVMPFSNKSYPILSCTTLFCPIVSCQLSFYPFYMYLFIC